MLLKTFNKVIKSVVIRLLQSKTLRGFNFWFDTLINFHWNNFPFGNKPIADEKTYLELWKNETQKIYPEIDLYEKTLGFSISTDWINNLALHTQVVVKSSPLCWQHGRILYSKFSNWMDEHHSEEYDQLKIWETGTARGFSALCISMAMFDMQRAGIIMTFDVLPHTQKIYWNCIDDLKGPKTRAELLKPWQNLVNKYIIFQQGDSKMCLNKVVSDRIHFAFLDGSHTYKDVLFEFLKIKDYQKSGDVIVFDDYNSVQFPGLVRAVNFICEEFSYNIDVIYAHDARGYAIATKI
jgi:hypothetical protein